MSSQYEELRPTSGWHHFVSLGHPSKFQRQASWQRYCTAKLRRWTEGATCIRQGDHHVWHWPTFLVYFTWHFYETARWEWMVIGCCVVCAVCSLWAGGVHSGRCARSRHHHHHHSHDDRLQSSPPSVRDRAWARRARETTRLNARISVPRIQGSWAVRAVWRLVLSSLFMFLREYQTV